MAVTKKKDQEGEETRKLLGKSFPLRIGDQVKDLHPVLLKDWPDFKDVAWVLDIETLHELFFYIDAPEALDKAIKIICRVEEVPEMFGEMSQLEYESLRSISLAQNRLDFKALLKKKQELTQTLSQLQKE